MTRPNLPVPYDPDFPAWQQPTIIVSLTPTQIDSLNGWVPFDWDQVVDPRLGRSLYFDKLGNPISMRQWGELRELGLDPDGSYGSSSYLRIGDDLVGEARVSTVWLGIDHGWPREGEDYRPVIFETMIFDGKYDSHMRRYCTEDEARKGHTEAVTDLRAGMTPWWSYGGMEDDEEWEDEK